VDRVAIGVGPQQTVSACREAEADDGPSLLITYGRGIGQGGEMRVGLDQQSKAGADLAQPTVRQRWQVCEGTATGTAGDFPANARKDR
jgi:hypothetical protein